MVFLLQYTCLIHQNVLTSFYQDHYIDLYKKKNPSYFEGCIQKIFLVN